MTGIIEILISLLLLLGAFFTFLGSVGIIRFKDVYGRLHSATKSATLGVISIMTAAFLYFLYETGTANGQILLTILFVFLTAPVAAHMISQSAYRVGVPLWGDGEHDDLKQAMKQAEKTKQKQKDA